MDNKENNSPLSGERVRQVKSVEDFAANENEKKSIRNFYEGWKAVHIHNEGLSTLCKVCPPEQYGEDEDCEELQNIIREMYYRIAELEAENAKLREALEGIKTIHESKDNIEAKHVHWESVSFGMYLKAEQALKGKETKGE